MVVALLVFVGMTGGILGIYALVTWLPRALAAQRLERRLTEIGPDVPEGESELVMQRRQGPLPVLDRLVTASGAGAPLSRLIDQAGIHATPGGVVLISVALGAAAAIAAMTFLRLPIAAVAAGIVGTAIPFARLRRSRTVRLARFEEQFPEALDLLSRALRAGHAFQSALAMVASEMPSPVGPEFKRTFDQQNFGLPLRDAMNGLAERVPILDVRFFVTAVAIQRDTGGNLSEILDNLSHVVRERFKIRRQVRVHTAHGRFTGYVLLALPACLAIALSFISPEQMKLLFYERIGQMLVAVAVVLQVVGYVWIRQVIKIEV